ncbi:MAG TPA: hypothetical protein VMB18_14000 [Terriglobales bacterium]|nr:hypothetical protein [Terriglobales bacterium]
MRTAFGLLCVSVLLVVSSLAQDAIPDAPQPEKKQERSDVQKVESVLVVLKNLPAEKVIGPYIPSSGPFVPLTGKERAEVYLRQTFVTPGPYVVRLFSAGVDQARDYPSQWGGGIGAYGERVANRYGRLLVANSVSALGNAALGYEPRYDLCRCRGFGARVKHAVVRDFVTYDRTEIKLRPAIPSYAGAFVSGVVSSQWLPGRQNVLRDGGLAMLSQAGYGSAYNIFSEFAVDILRKITKKNPKDMAGLR